MTRSHPRLPVCLAALLLVPVPGWAQPQAAAAAAASAQAAPPALRTGDLGELLLELRLDRMRLADALVGYESGRHVLLPLGELARLLTLAIRSDPAAGMATGYVLRESRSFHLDARRGVVTLQGREQPYDPALVRILPDDLYVALPLLSQWLPLDFDVNLSSLTLQVLPREPLPLQARLAREKAAERAGRGGVQEGRGYPRHEMPYRWLSVPYIDQTFSLGLTGGAGGRSRSGAWSTYLTGDFLGTEAMAYLSGTREDPGPDWRFSLARNDPDAGLLGLLRARSAAFGSGVSAPSVRNISGGTRVGHGHGLLVSSRPLTQPSNFDRHTLEGELPPGWDVELYYNDALVGYQASGADARYRFEDQPLAYGLNEFRLVFNGPLGQQRIERQVFDLERTVLPPGEFYYTVGLHDGDEGGRSVLQGEWGVSRNMTLAGGLVRLPGQPWLPEGQLAQGLYLHGALRALWEPFLLNNELFHSPNGGWLNETTVKTRLGRTALSYSHIQAKDFVSEVYRPLGERLRSRDSLRLDGALPAGSLRLPYTLELLREQFNSGRRTVGAGARMSAYTRGASITSQLNWLSLPQQTIASGSTQLSRRIGATSLTAQVGYTLRPEAEVQSVVLSGQRRLAGGYRVNLGLIRSVASGETIGSFGLTRDFGAYGLGLSAARSSAGPYTLGLQLFVAIGRDPRTGRWRFDAQPRADSGSASVRVYVDQNESGHFDAGDEPVQNAAVLVNGNRVAGRTDASGLLWLDRLPVHQHVDLGLDAQTLEDPTWQPSQPGVRLVPRRGAVAQLDFAVLPTSEVEGTVYLQEGERRRGIGNALVELVDGEDRVLASTRSSYDGYYLFTGVRGGSYRVRISPQQLRELALADPGARAIRVRADGHVVAGADFVLQRTGAAAAPRAPAAAPAPTEGVPAGTGQGQP